MNIPVKPSSSKLFSSAVKKDFEDCFACDVNAILTPASKRQGVSRRQHGGKHGGL
ncbi:MAG: hypothetical protein P4M05_25890 [Bradyrhizobium sp.]|nr:hypothetical protein [Bradyrhizobium sp.]